MHEIDIQISGDNSIVDLEMSSFNADTCLFIHNDILNPAGTLYLIPPKTNHTLEWKSKIKTDDSNLDLMVLLNNNTTIHDGSFEDFDHVMITNHHVRERTNSGISFDDDQSYDVTLIIKKLKTNNGLIFSSHLALLASEIARDILCINLEDQAPILRLEGINDQEQFVIGKFEINSNVKKLTLNNVKVNQSFSHKNIEDLFIENTLAKSDFNLSNIGTIRKLGLSSTGTDSKIYCDNIEISNLFIPKGKFYIASNSYINFKLNEDGRLAGIDLVLDMSKSSSLERVINFPAQKFNFEQVSVIGASKVSIQAGGYCKKLMFENCELVSANNIIVQNIAYKIQDKNGTLSLYSTKIGENLIVAGVVNINLSNLEAPNIETYGLCKLSLSDNILIKMLKLNLNLNVSNPNNNILANESAITIDNSNKSHVQIDNILAKISNLHIKGGAKLGTVLIIPIDKISTLFWIEMTTNVSMLIDRLFIGGKHEIVISPDGSINIVRNHNVLSGSSVYASVSSATAKDYIHVKAGNGIRFDGKIHVINAVGLFTESGDIIVNGDVFSENSIVIASKQGEVISNGAKLEAKSIAVYSNSSSYFHNALIKAQDLVLYSLNSYVQISESNIKSCNIVVVANGDIDIDSSELTSTESYIQSGKNVSINNSNVISCDIFIQSVHDFLQINSNIRLVQHPHVLFANQPSLDKTIITGGINVATDIEIIGLYDAENKSLPPAKLAWKQVKDISNTPLLQGSAYIEANRGFIIGSTLDSNNSVIIKTHDSIEVVPLSLYNETLDSGGFNKKSIVTVISKINAGLIQINAKNSATFVGSLLKAASGSVDSEVIFLLNSPESIATQQNRVKTLTGFIDSDLPKNPTVGDYFDFSKSTHVESAISNLSVYSKFSSKELYFTQKQGDIGLDKSIGGYEKLQIKASNGKILIQSPNLQNIYQGSGGGNIGKQSALDARTIIGGDNVYLIADEVISEAGRFNVSGELKIITKNGVHFLPVSVHQSLMYHKGSKATISEYELRLIVSEINAGYLDIKAGGAFNAVSALIQATGINLDVGELNLLSEREIFEKRIVFEGKEKWYGGSNESTDYFKDGYVIPTLIKTNKLNAQVNGKTTMEAAQILVKEESYINTSGDVNMLAKYDIHVHDHESSKSYIFNFDKDKLKVAGTKTVKEHFYGESPVPTLYYNHGNFYGYSAGKVHLLGSKIIGDDIYLFAKKGIKLEAAPFCQEKIVTISEECVRVGFSTGGGQHSVDAEFISQTEKTRFKNTFYDSSALIARNNLVLETPELIEIISSKMQFNNALIKARGLYMHTHSNKTEFETTQTTLSVGLHFGVQENISSTAKTVGHVLNKTGVHWLDILDRALNGYEALEGIKDISQDINKLSFLSKDPENNSSILQNLKSVQYGAWASLSASTSHTESNKTQAVDNQLIGGDIDFVIEEDAIIEGIKCDLDNFSLKAENAFISTSSDTSNQETYSANINLTIPISGSVGGNLSAGFKKNQSESISYHDDNVVNIKGKLELKLSGDGVIRGVQFIANEVDIDAKNFIVESLQDVLKARMQGMNMSFGMSGQNTNSFGVKADMGKQDAAWTNAIGSIIGRNVVNVTVQQTLEIAGGLIANAEINEDGSLTDKGQANIKAGKIIARTLHDYDDGYSYGVGISLSKTVDPKTGDIKYGTKVPVKYSFNENSRDVLPTIGKGNLDVDIIESSINRDINKHISEIHTDKASLDAKIPVSDMWEAIKPKTGVNSGDDYDKDKDKEQSLINKKNFITAEISKEALHNALLILKSSELGYSLDQLVDDQKSYNISNDVLDLDLTIAALNKYSDTHEGYTAGAATRISKELTEIRNDIIQGGPSFSSVWEKTKDNLMSSQTSILNPTSMSLDAMGNMVSYVEDKVGYILSSNMPKTSATLKAGLGYTMEKIIKNGIEGAVEVFGKESVESALDSIKKGLDWVDNKTTKGHQKLIEYAGIYAATQVLSKLISTTKHTKIPDLEDMISSLSKQEAHGVKILEKNGLNDELRNFSTSHKWENFADHVSHLESKLPDAQDMFSTYPKEEKTLGIRKVWDGNHNEVVIKKAKPDSKHACQQIDYVSIKSNGQILTKDGNFIIKRPDGLYKELPQKNNPLAPDPNTGVKLPDIESVFKPAQHPDAHISLSEWIKWKEWNKPK